MITNGTYVGNETITLTGNLTISAGSSLKMSNVTLRMNSSFSGEFKIHVLSGGTLNIERSNITSAVEDDKHNYGFLAEAGSNLTITSSEVHYVGWSMNFTQSNGIILRTQNVTIRDCDISNNYAGITIYQVSGTVTIENNNISWSKRNGITVIGSDVVLSGNNVSFSGMIMDPNWGAFAGHGILLANATTGLVYNNDLNENYWDGLYVYMSSDITVKENRILSNRNEGAEIESTANILFEGNNASHNMQFAGLSLWYSDDNTISNNTFFQNGNNGLYMYRSWNNELTNNTAIGSQRYHGFSIEESYFTDLLWNNASLAARYGVWIGSSDGSFLMLNNISSNSRGGLYIHGGMGHRLMSNDIDSNSGEGVWLVSSSFNTLWTNTFRDNTVGVRLTSSVDTRVVWNNFISNSIQALDDLGTNDWNFNYPLGGNYWDDYSGFDIFCGPNQDQPGSDRLGDVPYVIDGDSQDNYPLTLPFNFTQPGPAFNIGAVLSGNNDSNVTLSWNLSWNDWPNGTVANYAIYYGTEFNPDGSGYAFLTEVSAGNSSYVHENAGYGDQENYYYMVVANNSLGLSTKGGNQAGKFTRNLRPGIHLISSPLFLGDAGLDVVLNWVNFSEVWYFNSSWRSYSRSKYPQNLPEFDYRMAYWVNVIQEANFTVAGKVAPRVQIDLKSGWNLVGYPSPTNATSAQSLAGVPVLEIEGFDIDALPYHLRRLAPNDDLVPGYGCWIRLDTDGVWTIDNS